MKGRSPGSVSHPIAPVWDAQSSVLLLGSMPSPKSREAGFFYMHPQNRFWRVLPAVFGETLSLPNGFPDRKAAVAERRDFLLRRHIALWDVLSSCDISGAADSSIRNAVANDFHEIFKGSRIRRIFCTGKTAFALWEKLCAAEYALSYGVAGSRLPSTSPANAAWTEGRLVQEYARIREWAL